jgi:hypothetical protein
MRLVTIRQALRMKLHAQQKRHATQRIRLQFEPFYNSVVAPGDCSQRRSDFVHRLVVRAVYAQFMGAGNLGE